MLETVFNLLGINANSYHLDDNVVFVVLAFILLYCIGYVFNFFQCLLERATSKRGR